MQADEMHGLSAAASSRERRPGKDLWSGRKRDWLTPALHCSHPRCRCKWSACSPRCRPWSRRYAFSPVSSRSYARCAAPHSHPAEWSSCGRMPAHPPWAHSPSNIDRPAGRVAYSPRGWRSPHYHVSCTGGSAGRKLKM